MRLCLKILSACLLLASIAVSLLTLGVLSGVPSVETSDFTLRTDKSSYFHGEEVKVIFSNDSNETVCFPRDAPFIIHDSERKIVHPAITLPAVISVASGDYMVWRWNQLNGFLIPPNLVPPGTYTVVLLVYDEGLEEPIAELSVSFEILDPPITIETNSTMTDFKYDPHMREIGLNLTGSSGSAGYLSMAVPVELLSETLMGIFDGSPNFYLVGNGTHFFAYFTYTHSEHNIRVLSTILGDLNGDRAVNYHDLFAFAKAYGSTPPQPNWDVMADLNMDEKVSYRDLYLLAHNYGEEA